MRRLVAIAIGVTLALAVSCVPVSFASAREYTTPTPEDFTAAGGPEEDYAMVKNPDGTYTEYYAEAGNTDNYAQYLKGNTYSGQAIEEADRVAAEEVVDEGTTGQDGSIVLGSDGNNLYAAEIGVDELRTGVPYASTAEAELGDSMITEGIEADTLPTTGAVAAGLAGTILTAGGAVAAGIGISVGLDELVGVPSFLDIFNEAKIEPGCVDEGMRNCKYESGWMTGRVRMGEVGACTYDAFASPFDVTELPGTPKGELCEFPEVAERFHWEYEELGEHCDGVNCVEETTCVDVWLANHAGSIGGDFDDRQPGCTVHEPEGKPKYDESTETDDEVPSYCPPEPAWLSCFQAFSGPGGFLFDEPSGGYDALDREAYAPLSTLVSYKGFPAAGLSEHESHVETPTKHSLKALVPVETPVEVPPPDEIPDFRYRRL